MAEKEKDTIKIQHAIDVVCSFLLPYLPLANAHNTDFIVDQKWTSYLSPAIAKDLELLDEQDSVHLPSANVEALSVKLNSIDIKDDAPLETKDGDKSFILCPFESSSQHKPKWNKDLKPEWCHGNLTHFLHAANQCRLPSLGVLTELKSLQTKWSAEVERRVFVDKFMSVKKCHEIDQMTELCHMMSRSHGIDSVVDIGSGRGYLGCHLALMYMYKVLGVDSSDGNTHSAAKRTKQLHKQWGGLVKNATSKMDSESNQNPNDKPASPSDTRDSTSGNMDGTESAVNCAIKEKSSSYPPNFVPITQFVTSETDLQQLLADNFTPSSNEPKEVVTQNSELGNKKCTCTCDSGKKTNVCNVCDLKSAVETAQSRTFMLTGLHTCGNLASSLLQLFVANPSARLVCNVGCCYNHIDEAFLRNPFLSEDEPDPPQEGFPISQYLRSHGCQLGRNARMLAVQAPDRIAHEQKLPSKSIFWRALLQVILRDVTGEVKVDWNVGKIGAKCHSFWEYVRKGLHKLKIDNNLSDADILGYEERYAEEERKMNLFFQLRACLSPSIEALILLDRLLYLLEQPAVKDAHLIQLFDSVKSPRCYAIVATKLNIASF